MKLFQMFVLRLALVFVAAVSVESELRRVCYHTNWAQYRNGAGKFFPENIDPQLCTHIIYSFAKLNGNKLFAFEWNDESTPWMKGMYERFNAIKKSNPSLKTLIAVGGWNMASAPFTAMVASSSSRQEFATSTVKFLRDHNFDGLDIDWEYPAGRGSPPEDKQKYAQLLQDVRREFESEARTSGKPRLLLTAAIPAGKDKIDPGYDFPVMVKNLDMFNLMTYDLHGSWEDHTGHNSPLYTHAGETGNDTYLNLDWAASYWVKNGVPPSQINIGMGLYGRSFTLQDPSNHDVGSPARGAGDAGMYTGENGFVAYYEICDMLKNGGTKYYIDDQMVPYAVKGQKWVGYDDRDSLRKKVQYTKQNHFGGVMVWALDLDDFSGSCGEGKYPLLTAINDEISQSSGTVNPITTVGTVPTQAPVQTQGPQNSVASTELRRVCYHTNWAQYRNGAGKFFPENIDPQLCTHIIYSFAKLNGNKLFAFEWNDESTPWMKGMYERFNAVKKTNPNLKTLIAVGGWNMASAPFTAMVASSSSRQEFATSTVKFLRDHNFDGLDIDWEYPAGRGSPPEDKQKYAQLLQDVRREFESEARTSGKPRLLLTAAIPAGKDKIDPGYDFPVMVKNLDMFNLMTYDLHGSWEDHTGHNSPLYMHAGETGNDTYLNLDWAASYWVKNGVPPSQINIGMSLYGRSFTLQDPSNHDVGSPARGAGDAGLYTGENGFMAYYEICEMLKNGGTKYYIDDQMVPYAVKGQKWVGYDDRDSLRKKVQYTKQNHFGGVMVWALDLDDFSGSCGEGKYPLLTAINDEISQSSGTVNPITTIGTVPTQAPTQGPQNSVTSTELRRVCYHTNWAQYRNGAGKFFPENIDPHLCTHIIYAFAKLNGNKLFAFEWNDESTPWMKGMYERFNVVKKTNPNLKTLIAVGGWNMASAPFTAMVASSSSRQEFATSTVKFLRDHNFDGLDIDWEYPAGRGSPPEDKQRYAQLLQDVRREFESEARTSGKSRLLLTAAVPAGKDKIDPGYDFPVMVKNLDMFNLMTYDLHGSWEDHTGHNSPLYTHAGETGNDTYLNLDWAASYWVKNGVPPSQINIGMGLYGRSFTLQDPSDHDLGSSARGAGDAGMYTGENGFMAYYEICDLLKNGGTRYYIDDQMVPYAVKGQRWVGYDDRDSLRIKVQYTKQNHFGGVMVWALDLDDFSGSCGEGKYPLLTAINDEISQSSGTVNPITTVPTQAPTQGSQNSGTATEMRRVCYYTNWAQYRNGAGKFFPENVDPQLCTHLIYSFAKLNGNKLFAFEWNDESTPWMKGMYERFNAIKKTNPSLKTLIAVGGWNMASAPFTAMVASSSSRQEFATSTVKFLRDHNFDGLDIDWEYPAGRGSPPEDKQRYAELLQDVRREFESEAKTSGKPRLLLTAAVPAGKDKIDPGYDFPVMVKNLDMFNLMTYDLHGSWEDHTGHNSPLYIHAGETGNDTYLNLDWAASYWVKNGVPPSQINIGMGLYGRSFTLQDPNNNDLGSPARGAGNAGLSTGENGFMAYYEICDMIKGGGRRYYIADQMVPYVVQGQTWVGYDDRDSLRIKVQYAKQNHFGGVMVWALDLDDFSGSCGEGKYPLLNAIKDELSRSSGTGDLITTPDSIPTTTQLTQSPMQTQLPTQAPMQTQPPTQAPVQTQAPTTQAPVQTHAQTQAPVQTQPPTQAPVQTQAQTQAPVQTQPPTQTPVQTQPPTQAPVQTQAPQNPVTTAAPITTHQVHHIGLTTNFNCLGKTSGFYPSPDACDEYYICAASLAFEARCASGLQFNPRTLYCDWPYNVHCSVQQPATNQPSVTQKPTNAPVQTSQPTVASTQVPIVVTNAPVTQAPVVTNAPVTQAPAVTNAPVTQAPAVTNAPVTQIVTQAPFQPTPSPTQAVIDKTNFCRGKSDGHHRDPDKCSDFFLCSFGLTFHEYCAPGTVFNEKIVACDYPINVPECLNQIG